MKPPSPSADSLPETIGPYRLEATIGEGGMGEVYRGYDERLDRPVALKRIKTGAQNPEQSRERFRREARALARVRHPSVVEVYDWVEGDESDWLVMELLEGQPLSSLLEEGPVDLSNALMIVRDIADGLAAVHAHGIVHRDLKPANIMLIQGPEKQESETPPRKGAAPGRAKLLDFGLAKRVTSMDALTLTETISHEGQVLGTVTYMSPEQATGRPLDPRSDLFSLGVLLYEMLTGESPFRGDNAVETLTRICTVSEAPLHRQDPTLPMAISDLVARLLHKEPEHRLQRADETVALLDELMTGLADGGTGTEVRAALRVDRREGSDRSLPTTLAGGPLALPPGSPAAGGAHTTLSGSHIRTLLLNDLVDSTRLVERLGDARAAQIFEQHDRVARDLLQQTAGREIDKSDGFLMLFDRPIDAVRFALGYHAALAEMSEREGLAVSSRVGIHVGEVVLRVNPAEDIARGAKPLEVEGLAKATAARFMSLAGARQTLISRGVFDLARRATVGAEDLPEDLLWAEHGRYRMQGLDEPVEVFEVGVRGASALSTPKDTKKAKRVVEIGGRLSGWRLGLALAAVLMLVVLAGLGGRQLWHMREVPAPRYVVVPSTEVVAGGPDTHRLQAAAIQAGLLRALQGYQGIAAIEPSARTAVTEDPVAMTRALGANEALLARLECDDARCQVALKRLSGVDGQVIWSHRFVDASQSLLELDLLVAEQLRSGFLDFPVRPGVSDLQVRPEDYDAMIEISRRYDARADLDNVDEILAALENLQVTSPRFLAPHSLAGKILRLRFVQGRDPAVFERARAAYVQALAIAPEDPRIQMGLATLLIEARKLDEAEASLDEAERFATGEARLFMLRAQILERRGQAEEALAMLREAVRRQDAILLRQDLADMEIRNGHIDAARDLLEANLARHPEAFASLSRLARLELMSGTPDRAAMLYEQLVERDPGEAELTNLGVAYLLGRNYDRAATVFERALDLAPTSPFALLNLADAHFLLGETAIANELYARTLERVQSDVDPERLLTVGGQALAHLGQAQEAIAAAQQALRNKPDHPAVAYEAALIYLLAGEQTSALLHARRAIELGFDRRWFAFAWFDPLRDDLEKPSA